MNDWLRHRTRTSPEATALIEAESGEEWNYARVDAAVGQTAGRLAALGVEADDHVGVLLPTGVPAVRLIHATMRLGATLVPLNARLTAAELGEGIDAADVTTVVCDAETEERAVEATADVPVASVDGPQRDDVAGLADRPPAEIDPADWERDDTLALAFTSGTTGSPKPVVLTLENVLSGAIASVFRLGVLPDDRWLVTLATYHMGGLAPVYRSTLYGTTVVLRSEFEPGAAADDIDAYDVTGVSLVPTMLRKMLDSRGTLSDSLRFVLLGGAPAPDRLIRRCRDYSVPVHPTYGMTETASQIATATPEEAFEHVGTVGRPLQFTSVSVADEDGSPVDPGETGELVVNGPIVSPGYYDDPEATERTFRAEGLFTGDVGYVAEDGRVYVLNRKDDRIITGGENVDPGEVVELLRSHSDIEDAAVVGLPDEEWGERVAAMIVPDGDADLAAADVESYCRERLAGYKLPRVVAFAAELPRTASGTVDREAVRDRLAPADTGTRTGVAEVDPAADAGDEDGGSETAPDADDGGFDGSTEGRGEGEGDETDEPDLAGTDESDSADGTDESGSDADETESGTRADPGSDADALDR